MKRPVLLLILLVAGATTAAVVLRAQAPPAMTVLRDPGCGCCLAWVAHLEKAGFKVQVAESNEMAVEKDRRGVPRSARSCHTGVVAGYVIEGHVPAADIKRLLREKPGVKGLAVPGMPLGSPGMEDPGGRVQRYDVLSWDAQGRTAVFATH